MLGQIPKLFLLGPLDLLIVERLSSAEIQRLTAIDRGHHVCSHEKSADCASRGVYPVHLVAHDL